MNRAIEIAENLTKEELLKRMCSYVRWLCSKHHREWHRLNMPKFPKQERIIKLKVKHKFCGNRRISV